MATQFKTLLNYIKVSGMFNVSKIHKDWPLEGVRVVRKSDNRSWLLFEPPFFYRDCAFVWNNTKGKPWPTSLDVFGKEDSQERVNNELLAWQAYNRLAGKKVLKE